MALDKRSSKDDPLTEHDVAERYSHALLRVWRITAELSDDPELWDQVRGSRYLVVQPQQVIEALSALPEDPPVVVEPGNDPSAERLLRDIFEAPAPPETDR